MVALMPPQEETIESREGTAAHWALAELLQGRAVAVGQVAANGVMLTDEMIDCAEMVDYYISNRMGVNAHLNAPANWPRVNLVPNREVERTIRNAVIHPDNWGTPDLVEYCPVALFVDDYKHGHKYVEAVGNWQLANYAALKIAELAQQGVVLPPNFRVVLTIHQPRCYHRGGPHRPWLTTVAELQPYVARMRERYALAMTDDAPVYATDPEVCEDCPARLCCEAAIAAGYRGYEHGFRSIPIRMSPAALGLEYKTLRRGHSQLKARLSALEEEIAMRSRQSGGVPGWRMEFGDGRAYWDESKASLQTIIDTGRAMSVNVAKPALSSAIDTIVTVGRELGVDVAKLALLTPTQAKKAGYPAELVEAWTTRKPGAMQLVEDDGTVAARVFGSEA
jgi:hypothetical protein